MKVVIFGATGMVGKGALLECLDDRRVESVLIVVRHPSGLSHPKLREIIHKDFFDFSGIQSQFADRDACFFCLGVSSVGMSESDYYHLTYDLTLAAANAIAAATSQRLTFCYISGQGTDSTERGRSAFSPAKVYLQDELSPVNKVAHQRQNRKRAASAAVQSGLHVSSRLHPAA